MTVATMAGGYVQHGSGHNGHSVKVAVAASLAFHLVLLFGVAAFRAPAKKEAPAPGTIVARLAAPSAPSVSTPEPPKPQAETKPAAPPPPPVAAARPVPIATPAPASPSKPATAPAAAPSAAPSNEAPRSADPAPAPAPIAAAAAAPAAPAAPAATAAAAPASAAASDSADPGTLSQYRLAIMGAARRYKRYPRIAMDNNWEGKVEVRMVVGANGMISSITIRSGTGHDVLDQQALDMIRKAKPLAPIPAALRGKEFTIDLPVIFSLKEETGG